MMHKPTSPNPLIQSVFNSFEMVPNGDSRMHITVFSLNVRSIPYVWGGGVDTVESKEPEPLSPAEIARTYEESHKLAYVQYVSEMLELGVNLPADSLNIHLGVHGSRYISEPLTNITSYVKTYQQVILIEDRDQLIHTLLDGYFSNFKGVSFGACLDLVSVLSSHSPDRAERIVRELRQRGCHIGEVSSLPRAMRVPLIQGWMSQV